MPDEVKVFFLPADSMLLVGHPGTTASKRPGFCLVSYAPGLFFGILVLFKYF
jgi:hypothetical protein